MQRYKRSIANYQGGDLEMVANDITSLDGFPTHITGSFNCGSNQITSLVGGPQKVDGDYICEDNRLTDFEGCASHIEGYIGSVDNQITSLVGIHKIIKSCIAIEFDSEKITQGGIGLLLIANLEDMSTSTEPFKIIKSYLGTGTKGMLDCSKELTAKGYGDYAKL